MYHITCICKREIRSMTKGAVVCPKCGRTLEIEFPGPDPRPTKGKTITERYER